MTVNNGFASILLHTLKKRSVTLRQRDHKDATRWCDKRDLTHRYVAFTLETLFSGVLGKCVGLFIGILFSYHS